MHALQAMVAWAYYDKVRTGQDSHSQTPGVRVWLRETRVRIQQYFLEVSGS